MVELLISTLFVSILSAMSYGFARTSLISARIQEVKTEAQEVTVMALDVLVRDLRIAGFSAAGAPLPAILAAGAERIEVAADLNGDGDIADANERIAYSYNDEKQQLVRATGSASPQPMVRNVPSKGVHFSFFDAAGMEIIPAAGGVSFEGRRRIHRIDILLHVELPNPNPAAAGPLVSTVSSSVCLRNQ